MHDHNAALQETPDEVARRLAEEELSKAKAKSSAVTLDSIADGVISTDLHGQITCMNRVAQQLTGWPMPEAMGRLLSEVLRIVDNDTGARSTSPFEEVMRTGVAVDLAPNTALISRSGQRYLIEDTAALIRDTETSAPSGMVLVFRDVTEKSKLDIEFQQAKKLETIGRLAGGIAHDFNNLLAGIIGYSEMLVIGLRTDPRLQDYARSVLETAERAAKLTKQLLAFSRKGKMVSLPVDMHARITSAVALLQSTTDKRISIILRPNSGSVAVMGDPTLLEAALLNLGINARDATPVGGVITIETNTVRLEHDFIKLNSLDIDPGEYLEIAVSDTGAGMSEEVKGHLYEPFFTTKEIGRGTGLGLAAVYGTIKEHRGAITVKSNVGRGTTFKMYLPICNQSVAEVKEEEEEIKVFKDAGCVLLVDDERIVRETAAEMLRAMGFEVLSAENGAAALEIYKHEEKSIQLVILDVVMPQLSGPDTFFALKSINRNVKVIFSSGYTFENGASQLLSDGAFGFIQKPFRRSDLYKVVKETLLHDQPPEAARAIQISSLV